MWNEPFLFQDGSMATSLEQLLDKLRVMSDSEFSSHVTSSKHDFSQWISHIGHAQLGQFVNLVKEKQVLVNVISQYLDAHSSASLPVQNANPQSLSGYTPQVPPQPQSFDIPIPESSTQSTPDTVDTKKFDIPIPNQETEQSIQSNSVSQTPSKTENVSSTANSFKPDSNAHTVSQPSQNDDEEQSIFAHDSNVMQTGQSVSSTHVLNPNTPDEVLDEALCKQYADYIDQLKFEIAKVFVGQELVVHNILLSLLCDAHTLMEGVPGLAKSLLVEVLAKTIGDTKFKRIQFLPDMLPSDVVGGQIYNPKTSEFVTIKGPIFANFVLADEINRAPPKTHAAVMEAMAEKKINIDKEEFILERPFLFLATQNPLENKGTYELPESVLDRFMFKVFLDYPKREDEMKIITENATTKISYKAVPRIVMNKKEFRTMQKNIPKVFISEKIRSYILDIVEASRGKNPKLQGNKFIKYGAGVRGSIFLGIAAKAQAVSEGRNYVLPKDVQAIAKPTLIHRVLPNFKGKAYNITSDRLVEEILSKVTLL